MNLNSDIFFRKIWSKCCLLQAAMSAQTCQHEELAVKSSTICGSPSHQWSLPIMGLLWMHNNGPLMTACRTRPVLLSRHGCNIKLVIFKDISRVDILSTSCEFTLSWMPQDLWFVNVGLGNGLVPSGYKPLPDPMLTKSYITIWCQ